MPLDNAEWQRLCAIRFGWNFWLEFSVGSWTRTFWKAAENVRPHIFSKSFPLKGKVDAHLVDSADGSLNLAKFAVLNKDLILLRIGNHQALHHGSQLETRKQRKPF